MTVWVQRKAYGSVFKSTLVHKSSWLSVRLRFSFGDEMRLLLNITFLIFAWDLIFDVR